MLPMQYHNYQCVLPIGSCMLILCGEAVGFLLLALYFDNVVPDDNGVHQSLWCNTSAPTHIMGALACTVPSRCSASPHALD